MSTGTEQASSAAVASAEGAVGGAARAAGDQHPPRPQRPAHHAHAMMHCNLNTIDIERASRFHMALFGVEPRMRSISTDSDATSMGLRGGTTASITTFLYDLRGPRSAPALELVGWTRPHTEPAGPRLRPSGFTSLGFRVALLSIIEARLAALEIPYTGVAGGVAVRGETRPALVLTDPDGVTFEVVEITPAAGDPRRVPLISHERMRCTDLERTLAWYAGIGWEVRARGAGEHGPTASLVLPEDPTFSLEFEQRPAPTGTTGGWSANTQGLYRIALAVEDVQAAHASLVAEMGPGAVPEPVLMSMPDVPTGGFTVMFLRDPDGAVVELVERPRSEVRRPLEPR